MKAINFSTGQEIQFDDATTPEYAAAYGYHVESGNTASRFFASVQDNDNWWQTNTPFLCGKISVCAGDWAARTDGRFP